MGVNGFEDYWLAGARFLFKRTGSNTWVDFGVVQSASPSFTIDKVELEDPHSGVKVVADSVVTKIDETYDITTSNMNMNNLSLAFLGSAPTTWSQTAQQIEAIPHEGNTNGLVKIVTGGGVNVFNVGRVIAVKTATYSQAGALPDLVSISKTAGTLTFASDMSAVLANGDVIAIMQDAIGGANQLTDPLNAGTYTVSGTPVSTLVTLEPASAARLNSDEAPTADEFAVEASVPGTLLEYGVDWDEPSFGLDKGFFRCLDGGAITDGMDLLVDYYTNAVAAGLRTFTPQTASEVKGEGILFLSRSNFGEMTSREMPSISISPSSLDINATDFSSMVLQVKVLSSTTEGRVLQFKGAVPTAS